jgi:prephenate dehydrogenase
MTSQGEGTGRALVVGTGLIGGSVGLALRAQGWHVTGSDLEAERAEAARRRGALDEVGDDPVANLAFVCTPVAAAGPKARELLARPGAPGDLTVTDVSGVKVPVVRVADHPRFVGGHPMAGSEQGGLEGADANLFVGATWVLTPTAETDVAAFTKVRQVVASFGAEVVALSPTDHDRLVAVVSHVPHLVAATLMNAAAKDAEVDAALLRLAAGGFRDMTRVAAGQPSIWPDICTDNATAIVGALDRLLDDLGALRDLVLKGDRGKLLDVLERASSGRRALPVRWTRPDRLAELRVPVPDRQGVLAEFTTLAGDLGINIYDIEIAHSAEGPRGILVLVVDSTSGPRLREAIVERGHACTLRELS